MMVVMYYVRFGWINTVLTQQIIILGPIDKTFRFCLYCFLVVMCMYWFRR